MKTFETNLGLALIFLMTASAYTQIKASESPKPNIVVIYADDMGYRCD